MTNTEAVYDIATLQQLLDDLDEAMPGSDACGYYAPYCDGGYQEARNHVESYVSALLLQLAEGQS